MRPRLFVLSLVTALLAAAATAATAGEIRLASLARPGTAPYTLAWKFKELVEARSAGRLTVTVDPAGTPARESEVLDRLRSGGLDLAIITAGSLEGLVPTTRVLSFPFLFLTGEEADRVLDGVQGAALLRDVEAIGCKGLGFTEGGFRHLTNSIRPVRTAADVRDLKIRVTGSPVQTAFWSALGARPTPGPWPIYADLEAGVLEGQDNTLRVVETFGFDEVQPYLSLTRHAYIASQPRLPALVEPAQPRGPAAGPDGHERGDPVPAAGPAGPRRRPGARAHGPGHAGRGTSGPGLFPGAQCGVAGPSLLP